MTNEESCGPATAISPFTRLIWTFFHVFINDVACRCVDVKAVARDFRRHMIVHSDHVHRRQTTSGLTDTPDHNDDDVVVLRNISGCDNHARRSAASMVVEGKRRVDDGNTGAAFSRDLNWNWRSTSTDAGKYVDDSVQDVSSDVPEQLVPEIQQRRTSSSSLSNRLCVDSGRTYNDSAAMDDFAGVEAELQLYRKPSETPSAGSRTQVPLHRRMVASATRQTTRTAAATTKRESVVMRSSACSVREVVPCVWRRTETVFTPRVRVPDEVVPTFAVSSGQSNYSGVYERDLEDILESAATVSCCRSRRRRCHRNMAAADAFPSSHDDKFYFRLPPPPEVQSHRSSSPDSCYERSDSEPADRKSCASSDDDEEKELKLDEEQLTPAEAYAAFDCTASSFYRRLNHFLLSGNHGPAMHATVIEP